MMSGEIKEQKLIKRRAIYVALFMIIFMAALLSRLYYLQTVKAEWLFNQAENVWSKNSVIKAERGMILDRDGEKLAFNAKAYTLLAYPGDIEDQLYVARKLSEKINMSENRIMELINQNLYQVELGPGGRKINESLLNEVMALELKGIDFKEDTIRSYPNKNFASHVIGFINAAEEGVIGVELEYDSILSGQNGKVSYISDNKKRNIFAENNHYQPIVDGDNVVLTIESRIQYFVEKKIEEAILKYKPKNMTIIVADPINGEILALANGPNFNLNKIKETDLENIYQNFALQQFEPGSTFKVNVLAIALDENKINLEDTVIDKGFIDIPGGTIKNSSGTGEGEITYRRGLEVSSNVAFSDIALNKIDDKLLFEGFKRYGFGTKTGLELPFEQAGNIHADRKRYPFEIATASFGQGISVTPIQQIQAVSAIANGGYLIKPTIVKDIINNKDIDNYDFSKDINYNEINENSIMSKETSEKLKYAMEETVKNGSAHRASIDGIRVAGKTGTSEKIDETGKYSKDKFIISFIGFAPVENPSFLIYIALDEPQDDNLYGGTIAAPIFAELALEIQNYLEVKNQTTNYIRGNDDFTIVENYLDKYVSESILLAEANEINIKLIGNSNKVKQQSIKAGTKVNVGTSIILITGDDYSSQPNSEEVIREMLGFSKNDIIRSLTLMDISYKIMGEGYLVGYEFDREDGQESISLYFSSFTNNFQQNSEDIALDED